MKKIFVCSKYRGNYEKNKVNALIYCRFVYDKGYLPFAPHVFFPEFLDDIKNKERRNGIKMGIEMMKIMDEVWVFGMDISEGMRFEIDSAKSLKIKIRYFNSHMEEY